MDNIKYIFKVQELLNIINELSEVCTDHSLRLATKDYLVFEIEYDNEDKVGRLKTDWCYEIGGFTDEILINNLKEEHNFLVENYGEDIDFSNILEY